MAVVAAAAASAPRMTAQMGRKRPLSLPGAFVREKKKDSLRCGGLSAFVANRASRGPPNSRAKIAPKVTPKMAPKTPPKIASIFTIEKVSKMAVHTEVNFLVPKVCRLENKFPIWSKFSDLQKWAN